MVKSLILLVLLVIPSALCQSAVPELDNRSEAPVLEHDKIDKDIDKAQNEVATQPIHKEEHELVTELTPGPIDQKDNDVTSVPRVPAQSEANHQVPIFMDQHMIKVVANQLDGQDKEKANLTTAPEGSVKTEESANPQQVPIFMNQHIFDVVNKQMKEADKADIDVATEASEMKHDKPEAAINHQMPAFMDQQMVKGIIDFQKQIEQDRHNKEQTTALPAHVHIPEPIEHYKNVMYMYGHLHGTFWHTGFSSAVSSAINQDMSSADSLSVYPVATSHEYTSSGREVTRVEYVVTYNGRVLAEYEVTRSLGRPRPSQHLTDGLHKYHLDQYKRVAPETATVATSKTQAYITPVIITIVTVTVVAILLALVVVIHIKRNRVSPPKSKDKKELMKYILEADKRRPAPMEPIKPPPYSENPAYEV